MVEANSHNWSDLLNQRSSILFVLLAVIITLAFYTVTDISRLQHDHILTGADWVGYSICHRITDRSFSVAGRQLPLCARCTGMYLGIMLAFTVLLLAGRQRRSQLPPLKIMVVLIGFVILMGIDGLNSYSHFFETTPHLYQPRNWLRLATGIGTGLTMGLILFPALAQTLWRKQIYRSSIESYRELIGMVFLATIVVFLVLSEQPIVMYALGLISAVGVVITLASINGTAALILTKRDARSDNWRQAMLPLALGITLAIIQITVIGFLRYSLTGTMTGFPGL